MTRSVRADHAPGHARLWIALAIVLLVVHAALVTTLVRKVMAVERADFDPWGFLWIALGSLAAGGLVVSLARQRAQAAMAGLALFASAVVLTPGATIVVLLCLLSAHVLGIRVLRFSRTDATRVLPWTIPLLVGTSLWVGMIAATAGLKMHFAPVYAALLLGSLAWARGEVRETAMRIRAFASAPVTRTWSERAWLAIAFAVFAIHLFLVARPEVGYDANTMHLQISALVSDEHRFRFDATRYAWALMPLGADWAYSVANLLSGETAARATNLAFGVLLCAVVFQLIRRHAPSEIALAMVTLLASTPLVFAETSSLYVENLWTAFLMATLLVTLELAARRVGPAGAWPALALLAAGAMQCKVIGAIWLAPLLAFAVWTSLRATPPRTPNARGTAIVVIAAVLGAWPYVNAWIRSGNPVFPFMNAVFRSPLADTAQSFDNPLYRAPLSPWSPYEVLIDSHRFIEGVDGAAGLHWLLLIPIVLLMLVRRRSAEHWRCAILAAIFFVGVFTQQSYLRYLYPAFMLLAVLGGWAVADLGVRPIARVVLLVAGCALVPLHIRTIYTGNWTNAQACIGCVFDSKARQAFVDNYMGERTVSAYLTHHLPNARVGFLILHGASPAGYTGFSRAANWHDGDFYWRVATTHSPADIEAMVRKYKLTHIVYRTGLPQAQTPAIVEFRETRSKPVWTFRDFVVAAIEPAS